MIYKRTFFSLLSLVKGRVFTKHFVETKIGEIKSLFLALRLQPREMTGSFSKISHYLTWRR